METFFVIFRCWEITNVPVLFCFILLSVVSFLRVSIIVLILCVQVTVPDSAIPCGFFGGTGGHLHNVGVVLLDSFVPQQDKRDLPDQHRDQGQQQDQTSQEENGEPTIGGTTAEKAVPCVPDEPDTPTAVMRPPHSEAHLLVSLLQLCESMETSGCGMLNYYSKPSLESYRQSNIGHFAGEHLSFSSFFLLFWCFLNIICVSYLYAWHA